MLALLLLWAWVDLMFGSALTNKLMVRVTNFFETQVRVPMSDQAVSQHMIRGMASHRANGSAHAAESDDRKNMSDDQMVNWYGKILDSVRLRYRKLQRFVR